MRMLADPSLQEAQCAALRELLPRFGVYEDGELVPPSRVAARTLLRHLTSSERCFAGAVGIIFPYEECLSTDFT